jgi:hypothetical protein
VGGREGGRIKGGREGGIKKGGRKKGGRGREGEKGGRRRGGREGEKRGGEEGGGRRGEGEEGGKGKKGGSCSCTHIPVHHVCLLAFPHDHSLPRPSLALAISTLSPFTNHISLYLSLSHFTALPFHCTVFSWKIIYLRGLAFLLWAIV